jgi:hypothetical protein
MALNIQIVKEKLKEAETLKNMYGIILCAAAGDCHGSNEIRLIRNSSEPLELSYSCKP